MKIAIVGTHSTGKTTLIKLLHCEFQLRGINSLILPEFSRLCPYPINEQTTLKAQAWIQEQQISQEHLAQPKCDILICDRSTLDNYAYMHKAAQGRNTRNFEHRAALHMESYSAIFKTQKLNIAGTEDGVRTTEESFRQSIDTRIQYFLYKHEVPHIVLDQTIDYTQHIQKIFNHLPKNLRAKNNTSNQTKKVLSFH